MLINRKRSVRRGPTYRQTYVPHDQRQINTEPTPIKDEKTAQYYLTQLIGKGYINPYPYTVTIKNKDPEDSIRFEITNNQVLGTHGNINSTNMEIVDFFGNTYTTPMISNADILNRVGVTLYPIIAKDSLGVYNATSSGHSIMVKEIDGQNSYSTTIQSHAYWYLTTKYSYFTAAYVSASGDNMLYSLYIEGNEGSNFDVMLADINSFYLNCKELTVLVYPA